MYSTPVAEALAALPPLNVGERERLLTDPTLTRLPDVFARIPDPRRRRGRRYPLPFLLTCLVAALLCNCDSTLAVEQWCREHQPLLRQVFGPLRYLTPSGSLYRRLLPRLSVEHLEWALAGWVRATRAAADHEPLAVDGKTVRGARGRGEQEGPHLLSIYTHGTQETLLQVRVADKTNEIPVARAVLPLVLEQGKPGRIVTADALHTQTALVRTVRAHAGHVILTVKDNQPTLAADIALIFADPLTRVRTAQTLDARRGRQEARRLEVTTDLTAFLAAASPWSDIAQVGRLTRTVRSTRGISQQVVYLVTTLPPQAACPACLLRLVRGHWHIENGLHYVRDVTFGEDRSRFRTGNAPHLVATLRNLALTLIRRSGSSAIAAARRTFSYHPERALALLLPALPSSS